MKIFPPRLFLRFAFAGAVLFAFAVFARGQTTPGAFVSGEANWERGRPVQLATTPTLSPDGGKLAFAWAGDIWTSRVNGGAARRLTSHPAQEGGPVFSPDGQRIAFTSNRTGQSQVWIMPTAGGVPAQVTFHSEGSRVLDWYPDGKSVLVEGTRDFATRSASRFFRIDLTERRAESLLFDAEGHSASLSPDGTKLLFCRERDDLYRRGYRGSRSSQIWMAEGLETPEPKFTKLIARESGARSPLWKPDCAGFYYLGDHGRSGLFDVWEHDLKSGEETQLTRVRNDPAMLPAVSRGGGTMVFTQGFEFQRLALTGEEAKGKPRPIRLRAVGDTIPDFMERRTLTKADNLSFSEDGLEVAFAAGGDIWVMDTELREPIAVTRTPDEEREPVFSGDGRTLYFIRDSGSGSEIMAAERTDSGKYWWRNQTFKEKPITRDGGDRDSGDRGGTNKNDLQIVPGDERISWISGAGDLWVAKRDGSGARRLLESWNKPAYAWSPDGKWIAWAVSDSDFNRDVWISGADGKEPPYNLSRHPNNDTGPAWSPDGKILAFTGQRQDREVDIHYVYLSLSEEEKDRRDRTLESALEKMEKLRKKAPSPPPAKSEPVKPEPPKAEPPKIEPNQEPKAALTKTEPDTTEPGKTDPGKSEPAKSDEPKPEAPTTAPAKVEAPKPKLPEVKIDFERLAERVKRVSLAGSTESGLFWSHDGKRLAFTRDFRGGRGTYTISFPDKLTPVLLTAKTGSLPRWIARDDTLLWLVEGVPSALSKGALTAYSFTARQQYDQREYRRVAFLQIWRTMGETWYDEKLNHLDWEKIRGKYEDSAAAAPDATSFDRVVGMMLGELNGSHLGFRSDSADSSGWRAPGGWSEATAHLGLLFDRSHEGPGLKVSRVLSKGPADRSGSRVEVGEILLNIDGNSVDAATDLTLVLNGVLPRDVRITLAEKPGKADPATDAETKPRERELVIRPIPYTVARSLLEETRTEETRALVDRLSEGRLGYVPVPKMDWGDFAKFQEELFASGVGREGLIIDVRDNGGGFTTDHLLTALMPAEHAITVPRGGGPGYPQDRRVYATWNKPVTVLCNQNSFSNAEIFSHAIKELGRGKLVGVTTAGGVVSTGSTRIRDVGVLRVPFRGWFRKSDGTDMELNGARPDVEVWEHPDDTVGGRDRQIEKAVAVLLEDVATAKARPRPELKPASGR